MSSNKGSVGALFLIIFAVFFIVYVIYMISLMAHNGSTKTNYEEKVIEATQKYINEYYPEVKEGNLIIKLSTLREYNYITLDECTGYSIVTREEKVVIKAYVKCDKYVTKDYNEAYE